MCVCVCVWQQAMKLSFAISHPVVGGEGAWPFKIFCKHELKSETSSLDRMQESQGIWAGN